MADDKVSVEITIEEKQALRALAKLTRATDKYEKEAVKSFEKSDIAFGSFIGNIASTAATRAIGALTSNVANFARESFEAAQSMEKISVGFEVLTGSAKTAKKLMQELTDFSARTPFQLQGIAEAAQQLLSFGFSADSVRERIQKIGDVSAGSNSDLKEVALIYGQVAAAGKLTGERLLQLQERAIPIGAALAKTMDVAESEVRELVSAGKVGFREFEEAFNSMSEQGGMFQGAIQKQSETLSGSLSTLKDNFFLLQAEIGKAFAPAIIAAAKSLTSVLSNMVDVLRDPTPQENMDEIARRIVKVRKALADKDGLAKQARMTGQSIDGMTAALEKQLVVLEKRAQALAPDVGQMGPQLPETKKQGELTPQDKAIIDSKNALYNQLGQLKEQQKIQEAEAMLAEGELTMEQQQKQIENIMMFEGQKAQLAYEAELDKNKKIKDAKERAIANQIAYAKKEIAVQQSVTKAYQQQTKLKEQEHAMQIAGFARATAMAAQLAKKGTAEQKALSIASSTINTYAAATRAYKDYPYPANIAVMATTIAAGLAQVKEITKQSFATGGVVGGFTGASMGNDNTIANVRTGEMILNGQEQKELFDIATGRKEGEQGDLNSKIDALMAQPIIVEVDGREIARAVRNQKLEGYAA